MDRSIFLKRGLSFLGMAIVAPSLIAQKDETGACTGTVTETAGPFPTINPASLATANIVGDRIGVAFTVNILVKGIADCNPVQGIIVDIWHCDKDGYYSQYGGTQMQTVDYTGKTFLRGRQVTDANGLVSFTSIFPGWYTSRATHIHVHMYTSDGQSLLISQIAFPEGTGSAVSTVNAATQYGYTKGMTGYTYNSSDNVFSDGTSTEMSTITGTLAGGYALDWTAYVNAASTPTGLNEISGESQFQIRQNFPNPCSDHTKIPLVLKMPSDVRVSVMNLEGKEVRLQLIGNLSSGEQLIDLDVSGLATGNYIYKVKVTNISGTFIQAKQFVHH